MSNKVDLCVVVCCFQMNAADVKRKMQHLLSGKAVRVRGFVVSSKHETDFDLLDDWTALSCDNIDLDFSAYFRGADAIIQQGLIDCPVLFLNDTLFTQHSAYVNFAAVWRQFCLIKQLDIPAIVGKADRYTTICMNNPWGGQLVYITTFCFLLNAKALPLFQSLQRLAQNEGLDPRYQINAFGWGERVPITMREFIKAALIYDGSPYLWYRLKKSTYDIRHLTNKARCIYYEHRLSGLISKEGCILPSNAGPRWAAILTLGEWLARLTRIFNFHR